MKISIYCLLIGSLAATGFAQEPATPTPLTDKEKLQSAEAFILLQNSQQVMMASPQGQMVQQHRREYIALLRGFQQSKGAAVNCTLTIKQDWSCPASITPVVTQSTQGPNSEEEEPDVSDPTPAPE